MYIDIHRHHDKADKEVIILRNLFPDELKDIQKDKYYSIGIHPWHVQQNNLENQLSILKTAVKDKSVIAIGEIGLDQKVNIPYLDQLMAFEKQIEIAEENKLPVIIHCVKAYDDIISIRKKTNLSLPWIIHWFNSSNQIANALLDLNCYLSYGYMLFKENSKAYKGFPEIPNNRIFFGTDDTEYSIEAIYKKAGEIKNLTLTEIKSVIKSNFKDCFNINL